MSFSGPSPLAGLIGRHRHGRTYGDLADASRDVVPASLWEWLEHESLPSLTPLEPEVVEGIAVALGLTPDTVRHYALASRAVPPGRRQTRVAF